MRIEEVINEGISDVVYHFTRIRNFFDIISDGSIRLSYLDNLHDDEIGKGYEYYLSATRSRLGGYHVNKQSGVLIALNGRAIHQNMKGTSIDFFGGSNVVPAEMEDRIFSNKPELDNIDKFILKVDILLDERQLENETFERHLEEMKYERFPVYVYDDQRSWLSGRPEKARYIIKDGKKKTNFDLLLKRKRNEN